MKNTGAVLLAFYFVLSTVLFLFIFNSNLIEVSGDYEKYTKTETLADVTVIIPDDQVEAEAANEEYDYKKLVSFYRVAVGIANYIDNLNTPSSKSDK